MFISRTLTDVLVSDPEVVNVHVRETPGLTFPPLWKDVLSSFYHENGALGYTSSQETYCSTKRRV